MTLHKRETIREQIDDSVFANREMSRSAPKYRFPPEEWSPLSAFQIVSDELMLDGNSRQNLATFCQTWEEPEVHRLMDLSIDKNMIDKDEYPQTAEIERRCVHMLADLWNAPEPANTVGSFDHRVVARPCMLGGMAAASGGGATSAGPQGKPTDNAQPGVRAGAGGVAQVRPVLGHRDARDPHGAGPLRHGRRGDADPGRREHHRRGAHPRGHLHRLLRAGGRLADALDDLQARHRAGHRHPRRRGQRRLHGAVLRPRPGVGLPPAPGEVHQHLGPQVRPGAARGRAGWCGATPPSSPTSSSST